MATQNSPVVTNEINIPEQMTTRPGPIRKSVSDLQAARTLPVNGGPTLSVRDASSGSEHIVDAIWGEWTISEPALVALLRHPAVNRLQTVLQHGITGLLGMTVRPPVTRLEVRERS